ncbi:muscle M-line assembly protein unc-89-like isoform X3 [Maniola jurtina]|uniref:muscle M-line assembly protein unc-89-like isoform X3 n=1 Tax=Maniola jurtina TaxID=191418 RepID=UPI001E68A583|nr:muscle M-line assembly protein unc-89-like isoform X3 [Maniola jurtina]
MSKGNPLGLIASYGDSDEESDDGASKRAESNKMREPAFEASQAAAAPAGIHPAPIPHCPWSACYDENSGFTYYWNQQTNAVTWEAPPEYLLALKLAQQHLHTAGSAEVTAEEWQLYQQALAEKQGAPSKVIDKEPTTKTSKKQDETTSKDKHGKNSKKRPASDDEEEKIELITSYHNSDSDSNDESEKTPSKTPPLPKPPSKLPSHTQKKQKTKPVVEYGPPLPPNQEYTVPIGPELPPELMVEEKPKSPEPKAEISDVKVEEDVKTPANSQDEDSQEEQELLKRLKDKAKLLEKLGGELPSELQQIIKDESLSNAASPKTEIKDINLDIDDLLEEIEKKELPRVKSKEKSMSNTNSGNVSPRSSDSRTPPLEELKALFPSSNGPIQVNSLFPSAANIDESKPNSRPETPPIVEKVEKEKVPKENVYLMDSKEPKENVSKKKLRISNSVLPERKKSEKVELPSYTTKYSQFIEGFSSERTGLGFTKGDEDDDSTKSTATVSSSTKTSGTINYGNGLTFTKGETLNEEKKDDDLDDLTDLLEAKLKFLNQIQTNTLSPVQEMIVQMQTLVHAFRSGALLAGYWRRWARAADAALRAHEAAAAPPHWLCVFQRSEGRYVYRREADGFTQAEYPAVANTDMEICTTPPHPAAEPKEEINPPLPPMPPPPPSPPRWWSSRATPPPPGTDPPAPHHPPAPPPSTIGESKKEIGDELLLSFYNDIAELEKTSGPTEPSSPEIPPPPPPPDISERPKERPKEIPKEIPKEKPKEKDCKDKVEKAKKKSKVKLSSSLGMKQKSVSSLVAKWQQVADEIDSD